MNSLNFSDLMRRVNELNDFNAQELLLREALATYEQTVVYADDYFMKVKY